MSEPFVRPASIEDCLNLASRMRPEDAAECLAASGHSPLGALLESLKVSHRCMTVEYEGEPAAMFGVVRSSLDDKLGYVWLLGSPAIKEFTTTFLRQSQEWLGRMGEGYDVLSNYVDCRNALHLKWLVWLGFELGPVVEKYGVGQVPFVRVTKVLSASESAQGTPAPAR